MSKLYYKDSVEAIYMAKKFGVKFVDNNGNDLSVITDDNKGVSFFIVNGRFFSDYNNWYSSKGDKNDGKYYVHPDSYHILGLAEVGDMVQVRTYCKSIGVISEIITWDHWDSTVVIKNGGVTSRCDISDCKILQRQGKRLELPEKEENDND